MTANEYLQSLLDSQRLNEKSIDNLRHLRSKIQNQLSVLEGNPRFYYAGSYGKKTMIAARYDLDIVIYWPKSASYTIKGIYNGVGDQLKKHWNSVQPKTVSWELSFPGNFHIDVVPGRALDDEYYNANLHRNDTDTTLKTSLKKHIDTVRSSGRRDAIRLMKLWRERRSVPLKKSFLLELLTIAGCSGTSYTDLQAQITNTFCYIRDNIETCKVVDPANSNNSLSDELTNYQRSRIKERAQAAINAKYWRDIFE